jgi:hypothetical protein
MEVIAEIKIRNIFAPLFVRKRFIVKNNQEEA